MEASPLTKAHDHARAAAVATRQSADTTVAISEHTLAAGEFANAASLTSSVEALRTLKLLEEHHRKLAEILKLPPEQVPHARDDGHGEKAASEKAPDGGDAAGDAGDALQAAAAKTQQPPGLASQRRYVPREMSSSIASNLASARGIRSKDRGQPLSPSVSNDQAPGNLDPQAKRDASKAKMQTIMDRQSGRPTWVPPMAAAPNKQQHQQQQHLQGAAAAGGASPKVDQGSAARDDGGYTRFYNTFGSLIHKISAPLAFAGLPLIQEEPATPAEAATPSSPSVNLSPTKQSRARASPSATADPDLSKIYSKATMRALVRDGHTAADSFYVVPSTGHTMSYANILSYAEKEKRRLEASTHGDMLPQDEDDDDFVDAREAPGSVHARRRITRTHSEKELYNTIEELSLENKSLKDMLDKLSKRLHTFEASAQSSALALAESYRIMPGGSPLPGGSGSGKATDEELVRKNHELEEQLSEMTKHMERLEKDNRKMQKTLEKYREKWETLKAGAKARRGAQSTTGESVEDARSQV
ncbi:hypothetical protein BBK36DRAFT_1137549 [Trichoderma citrinoviride]|uniref:Uncharacterized protein n=1 Tax=Trichoderma citrinoviride TaxID=58853 RepID=A0A2T4BNK6_9HYPO|nr:hypothetical protein BBK36DRAFT_1137549 [Trichoderma citrinoviride]PTB70903.1 hypothetical protein BBK36DRAFT_1137549 [Trichoderma citrinoviride]